MPLPDHIQAWLDKNPNMLRANSKFAPKLQFHERCAVLAAYKAGVERRLIAKAFGIARPTISFISRPTSKNYADVRREYTDLGHERFIATYLTQEVMERINLFRDDPELQMSDDDVKELRSGNVELLPNKKADKLRGLHRVTYYAGTIEVLIEWVANEEDPAKWGWFIQVQPTTIDGWDGTWLGDGDAQDQPFRTSRLALDGLLSAIEGTLI